MRFTLSPKLRGLKSDAVVFGWFQDQKLPSHPAWSQLSATAKTAIQKQLKRPGINLEWGSMTMVQSPTGPWQNIVIVGLGKKDDWSERRNRLLTRRIIRQALGSRWLTVTIAFQKLSPNSVTCRCS